MKAGQRMPGLLYGLLEPLAHLVYMFGIAALVAFAKARRLGHKVIHLSTNEKMTENQALYSRIGYVEYERRVESGYSRVYMRKQLA